jgi:hypothetical protein
MEPNKAQGASMITLATIGLTQCPNEPCLFLFRYLYDGEECYLLQYVDDSLISGTPKALKHLQQQLQKHFKCKFIKPKDFLVLDLTHKEPGEITLSMETFSTKMEQVLNIQDKFPGDVFAHPWKDRQKDY